MVSPNLRIEVYPRILNATHAEQTRIAKKEYAPRLLAMSSFEAYLIEGNPSPQVLAEIFVDQITQELGLNAKRSREDFKLDGQLPEFCLEVSFKPGVTDNTGTSAAWALGIQDIKARVFSRKVYLLYGELNFDQAKKMADSLLANPLIQKVQVQKAQDFFTPSRFEKIELPLVDLSLNQALVESFSLDRPLEELKKISDERCLALSEIELDFLKKTFLDPQLKNQRETQGMPRDLTDVEIEIIAQSWSEHCKHKIFAAEIDYQEKTDDGKKLGNQKIKGLYPSYIKKATKELNNDWLVSVFSDNAGIVRFDDQLDLCIKVETHNSPSALDPYGGALTGILGVNRDILGCGMGAKPVANMDVFCFGPPDWPSKGQESFMPEGLMAPRRIFEGVHKGVEDGGNKSGIPTINGAIHFDADYSGKPLVFVGTIGVLPQTLPSGAKSSVKRLKVGDKIVVIGGAVGADGIHGATFSSLELNEDSPVTAVQIGDPLTQKRVMDLLLEARDLDLYTSITDNGAGGLSSSIGEMATFTNGARLDLALCATKYPGLKPYEIMISESQERMSLGVDPQRLEEFLKLCQSRGVDAQVLGEFNDSGFLEVYYGKQKVALLDLHFLHESLPAMQLKAVWQGPRERKAWMPTPKKTRWKADEIHDSLLRLLGTPNIASKERWVRQYDHEVQGATALRPFTGAKGRGPSDAGGIWLGMHGGDQEGVVLVGAGLAPRMSLVDPYLMAQYAVDEAVRNIVASGADPSQICLLDNFCWPDPVESEKNPDGARKLAELVRCCQGLYDICKAYETPLVSGKDSMKNDFRGKNKKGEPLTISILPTLLVTAMGRGELQSLTTSELKKAGDHLFIIGQNKSSLVASEFGELYEYDCEQNDAWDFSKQKNLYQALYRAQKQGLIASAHDLSDGGLLVALAESMIGSEQLGARLFKQKQNEDPLWLYGEAPGRLLVSVPNESLNEFKACFENLDILEIGLVEEQAELVLEREKTQVKWSHHELLNAFTREF